MYLIILNMNRRNANPKRSPVLRALIIGMNYQGTSYELKGCINDSRAFKDMLTNRFGFSDIKLITDDTQLVTRQTLVDGFAWLLNRTRAKDRLVFYFSGHGQQKESVDGDETDGMDEVLQCSNGEFCSDDDIWSNLITKVPEKIRLSLFFDCCHSGTMADLKHNFIYTGLDGNMFTTSIENSNEVPGDVTCLSACYDRELSADGYAISEMVKGQDGRFQLKTGEYHGVFSYFLLKVLQECSFNIQWSDLLKALTKYFDDSGYKQNPQFSCSNPISFYGNFSV